MQHQILVQAVLEVQGGGLPHAACHPPELAARAVQAFRMLGEARRCQPQRMQALENAGNDAHPHDGHNDSHPVAELHPVAGAGHAVAPPSGGLGPHSLAIVPAGPPDPARGVAAPGPAELEGAYDLHGQAVAMQATRDVASYFYSGCAREGDVA